MGFNSLMATELLRGDSSLFTIQFPGVPSTHLINFNRIEGWILKPPSRFESRTLDWESSTLTTRIIPKTYLKCKCLVFINIKQTLLHKVINRVSTVRQTFIFYAFFPISSLDNVLCGCFK